MIAQVVFDLPLDGPFDYLAPEHLVPQIAVGMRVKVSFGTKARIGFVIGVLARSVISKLKPIQSLCDGSAAFNNLDLVFAREFCAYYGCSLGEALAAMLRARGNDKPSIRREHKPLITLYRCSPRSYAVKIQEIIDGYESKNSVIARSSKGDKAISFLILVPDAFRAKILSQQLHPLPIKIGTRSSVFECDGRYDCVIMVDNEDPSYKQEQMPMYDAAQVLLTRSRMYGFDVAFVGISPSVELMSLAREKKIKYIEEAADSHLSARLVDLTNYKFVPGLLSVPVRGALETALKAGKKSILVLNRRGSYRLTRCVDCGGILKCRHCDSPLIYSRSAGQYLCRHCTYTAPGDTVCPQCACLNWRSQGIGVEQLQTELKKYFSQARIVSFERAGRAIEGHPLADFDILISTSAVLRFQGDLQAQVAAFIDFDAELNRLDMRCAFNAFSFALHISSMALEPVLVQTRNIDHYVLRSLSRGKAEEFYDEELRLRKEFAFSPFKHWVQITWRGESEKAAHHAAEQAYDALSKAAPGNYTITHPLADAVGRKRDQFRFNVMVQADHVPSAVAFIKSILQKTKRPGRVIVTLNIDP